MHSFNYDVVGITKGADGCPRLPIPRKGGSAGSKEVVTKVSLGAPEDVEAPRLRTPPRPRADGATGAEPPPKEKSFLEKYWYCEYIGRPCDAGTTETDHAALWLDQTSCPCWSCWHFLPMEAVEEKPLPLLLELGESDRVKRGREKTDVGQSWSIEWVVNCPNCLPLTNGSRTSRTCWTCSAHASHRERRSCCILVCGASRRVIELKTMTQCRTGKTYGVQWEVKQKLVKQVPRRESGRVYLA